MGRDPRSRAGSKLDPGVLRSLDQTHIEDGSREHDGSRKIESGPTGTALDDRGPQWNALIGDRVEPEVSQYPLPGWREATPTDFGSGE